MMKLADKPKAREARFIEAWMTLPAAYRKALSHHGAIRSRRQIDPCGYTAEKPDGSRLRTFDPCNWYYMRAFFLAFPQLMRSYDWNEETVGDIFEALLGLVFINPNYEEDAPQRIIAEWIDESVYTVWLYITMERSCEVQLLAEAAGQPISIDPEMARRTRDQVGSHFAGWFSFQPLFDKIVADQPDLLE